MDSELNQSRRAEAVSLFIETNRKKYLTMVYNVEKRLKLCLGEDKVNTSLAEEVMSEVISDVIDGTRKWDMSKFGAEQILWYNIASEVSALAKKETRYVLVSAPLNEGEEDEITQGIDNMAITPAEDIEGGMDAEKLEDHCANVILKDDEDSQIVFYEMLEGKKQKQIAVELGLTVEKAETIIRGIKRKISKQIPYHMIENLPKKLIDKILNQT